VEFIAAGGGARDGRRGDSGDGEGRREVKERGAIRMARDGSTRMTGAISITSASVEFENARDQQLDDAGTIWIGVRKKSGGRKFLSCP
jgi:hypothetical protein